MAKVIVELCQNFNGDWEILKKMIRAAKEAGADYAKVQSMLAEELTKRDRFEEGKIENGKTKVIKRPYKSEYERLKPLGLSDEMYVKFVEECKKVGIEPLTTIFTRERVPFIAGLGMKSVKVASYDCCAIPLIKDLKKHFNNLIISTGATYDKEIERTAKELEDHKFSFLHCVTIYPTPIDALNLKRMDYLRKFTKEVGFSDHSLVSRDGINASIIALALGADIIERHFSILPESETKDGPVSINPEQLAELVKFAKMPKEQVMEYVKKNIPGWETALGEEKRELTPEELLNRDYYMGRFASKVNSEVIYNWEDKEI
jgi:N,N'-diacetyllegionaminate synthase